MINWKVAGIVMSRECSWPIREISCGAIFLRLMGEQLGMASQKSAHAQHIKSTTGIILSNYTSMEATFVFSHKVKPS